MVSEATRVATFATSDGSVAGPVNGPPARQLTFTATDRRNREGDTMKLRTILFAGACALALAGCAGTGTAEQISTDATTASNTVPAVAGSVESVLGIVPALVTDVSNIINDVTGIFDAPKSAPATASKS
jgi:hypothetical protein